MKPIWHLTLNTGHGRMSYRFEVDDYIVAMIAGWLDADAFDLPGGYHCVLTYRSVSCFEAEVYSTTGERLVRMVFAGDPDHGPAMWLRIAGHENAKPREPWLAVSIDDELAFDLEAATWLGDFERCLAWGFVEHGSRR